MSTPASGFEPFQKMMEKSGSPPVAIESFKYYFNRLARGDTGTISEADIRPLERLPDIEDLRSEKLADIGRQVMQRAVIVKLNGGLGTGMGMKQAKSLLKVKDGLSFLDIIVRQGRSLEASVPLVFMNSFSTHDATREALKAYPHLEGGRVPLDFLQHRIPRVDADRLAPVENPDQPHLEWCPPGHGDVYLALQTSGMLDRLLEAGCEVAFVSNSDNLGAVLDPVLLGYFIQRGWAFMMEAADRTEADRKGGHLARLLKSRRYVLREVAQTPASDQGAFQDIQRHRYFNTNNIWLHLPSLKKLMHQREGVLGLPMIRNLKPLDPRYPESTPVYQLETAMGAAISIFDADSAGAVRVPRTRFTPVKSTNDLLAVRSDGFVLTDRYQLIPNPRRTLDPIRIDLDPTYYRLVDRFESRFPFGAPSLVDCESLQINGDVRFGRGVTLNGWVSVFNATSEPFQIGDLRRVQGELRV
ncbi:MAG: UTP--glucose-1-phosphate uridylyltransferase [Desulfosarcina sp.]